MDTIIPISICVVLPVAIVFITTWRQYNKDNKRAEILMKAIESNKEIDANKLAESLGSPNDQKSDILSKRLLRGLMFSFIGLAMIIGALLIFGNGGSGDTPELGIMGGTVLLAIGISYLIVYWVTYRQKQKENDCHSQAE
jgi:hypothetical protein